MEVEDKEIVVRMYSMREQSIFNKNKGKKFFRTFNFQVFTNSKEV